MALAAAFNLAPAFGTKALSAGASDAVTSAPTKKSGLFGFNTPTAQRIGMGAFGGATIAKSAFSTKATQDQLSSGIDAYQARLNMVSLNEQAQTAEFQQQQMNITKNQEAALGNASVGYGAGNLSNSASQSFVSNSTNVAASQDLTRSTLNYSLATQKDQALSNLYSQSISNLQSAQKDASAAGAIGIGVGTAALSLAFF